MSKTKVLIILSSLEQTGPGFVVEGLVDELGNDDDLEIVVLALSSSKQTIDVSNAKQVITLDMNHGKVSKMDIGYVQTIVDSLKPNVVFSHGLRSDMINSRLKRNHTFSKISTSHNNPFSDYIQLYGKKGIIMALLQVFCFLKIDMVVTLNPSLYKLHKLFLGKSRTKLIMNGVKQVEVYKKNVRNDNVIFGVVATFNKRKNQLMIVKNSENNYVSFWGEGPQKSEIKNKFSFKNNIRFFSFTPNKSSIFSKFDVFLSASVSEGMPMSVLEAISAGKPLVLSDISAHRYISSFIPTKYVRLFKNDEDLKKELKYFTENPDLIREASGVLPKIYLNYFSIKIMANKYKKLFNGEEI